MAAPLAAQIMSFLQQEPRFQAVNELRLVLDGEAVGWVRPQVAEALYALDRARVRINGREVLLSSDGSHDHRSALLQTYAKAMKQQGLLQNWRDEAMQLTRHGPTQEVVAAIHKEAVCQHVQAEAQQANECHR